jgi:hypothetical protein
MRSVKAVKAVIRYPQYHHYQHDVTIDERRRARA